MKSLGISPLMFLLQISIDCASSHVTLVSSTDQHVGTDRLKQELHPLLLWNVPELPVDLAPETLDYAFHLCLALDNTRPHPSDGHCNENCSTSNHSRGHIDQSKRATWSCPVWLPVRSAAVRTSVSVRCCGMEGDSEDTMLCTVMTETEDGVVYIIVAKETSPPLQIYNNCPFPLHFGQGLLAKPASEGTLCHLLPSPNVHYSDVCLRELSVEQFCTSVVFKIIQKQQYNVSVKKIRKTTKTVVNFCCSHIMA